MTVLVLQMKNPYLQTQNDQPHLSPNYNCPVTFNKLEEGRFGRWEGTANIWLGSGQFPRKHPTHTTYTGTCKRHYRVTDTCIFTHKKLFLSVLFSSHTFLSYPSKINLLVQLSHQAAAVFPSSSIQPICPRNLQLQPPLVSPAQLLHMGSLSNHYTHLSFISTSNISFLSSS